MNPVADPSQVGQLIVELVMGMVLAAFGTSPLTTFLVSLVKRIPALGDVAAPTLTFVIAAVLWIGITVAGMLGFQSQVQSFYDLIEKALPPLASFVFTLIGAPAIYATANKYNSPVIGYQRTPPDPETPF